MTGSLFTKRIPTLDGWRMVSISMVIWGHLVNYRYAAGEPSLVSGYLATLGVKVFFVISGFLITTLALNEEASSGRLDVAGFYRRRVFRILPAYLFYLAAVLVLSLAGVIQQAVAGVGRAALFVCNIPGIECGWFAGHSWSLAYEEQFYLIFPLIFLFVPRRHKAHFFTALHLCLAVVPLLLLALFVPSPTVHAVSVLVSSFACISAGVLLGCYRERFDTLPIRHSLMTVCALAFVVACIVTGSGHYWHVGFDRRNAVEALALPLAIAWLIYQTTTRQSWCAALLELPVVRYVGKMSFSLYLWQQLFTSAPALGQFSVWWMLPVAMASYHLIEKPFVRWGRKDPSPTIEPLRPATAEAR